MRAHQGLVVLLEPQTLRLLLSQSLSTRLHLKQQLQQQVTVLRTVELSMPCQ